MELPRDVRALCAHALCEHALHRLAPVVWLSYFMDSTMMLGKLRAWGGFLLYGSKQVSEMAYGQRNGTAREKVDGWASGCRCL